MKRYASPPIEGRLVSVFEVLFQLPVRITREDERRLVEAVEVIIKRPWNQPEEGIHWAAVFGSRPNLSEVDAALLGQKAAPEQYRPANGEEPTFNDDVFQISTCAREFVSDKERERVLNERNERLETKTIGGE